mmetsp:Transcript_26087/g.66235  ORF Transcript_26087/g.66235 Transcript_26087/m.66235 type:complete len:90 (-) Transcript_26087:97-366(-)
MASGLPPSGRRKLEQLGDATPERRVVGPLEAVRARRARDNSGAPPNSKADTWSPDVLTGHRDKVVFEPSKHGKENVLSRTGSGAMWLQK